MLVREAMQSRLPAVPRDAGRADLPHRLKPEASHVRISMLRRLSASRQFALGDRAGVLRSAQARSRRFFRLDTRQRVIVKALVSRHAGSGAQRGQALARHLAYLGRAGAGLEGARAEFFGPSGDKVDAGRVAAEWAGDRHHFRLIISPEHGDRIADLEAFTRAVMQRVAEDLGQPHLDWIGTCHFDTDQPHAHVLVRGRRASGADLVIPRDYIAYGIRGRAQEVAHELLGDLSRAEAERRIWRETQADRFTGFDRRLIEAADAEGLVDDGVGTGGAWSALTRGRLRHLEALGLAVRVGRRFSLDGDLEAKLRNLQLGRDIIRTLHQRRLETDREVRELSGSKVRGRVMRSGAHDELGAMSWVIVRDRDGVEHYARLRMGERSPALGRSVELTPSASGARVLDAGRQLDRGL
mgnify:CR=1 FL=1